MGFLLTNDNTPRRTNIMTEIKLMDHNTRIYDSLYDNLMENDILLYVTATGTGKSYVAGKFIQDNGFKALIICPKISICNNWQKLVDCDVMTYSKFSMFSKENILEQVAEYNIIIIDEAHHSGAPVWKKNIIHVMKNIQKLNIKILGLTADPNRYNDISSDITSEIFNNNIMYGYSLEDSIKNNILPNFSYVSALFSLPDKGKINSKMKRNKTEYNKDKVEKLLGKLDYNKSNVDRIKDILMKHLPNNQRKIIVFVSEIKEIVEAYKLFIEVFKDEELNIFSISSDRSKSYCEEQIELFKRSSSKISILINVDMLNEGLHISKVNTVIMLRKTTSPTIFFQQLGRGLESNNKNNDIVIFDFVGNKNNLNSSNSNWTEKNKLDLFETIKSLNNLSDQIIIHDYISKDLDIINEIYTLIDSYYWSPEEDNIIRQYYCTEGVKKCLSLLPGRTEKATQYRAAMLGIKSSRNNALIFSEEEIQIIKDYYSRENGTKIVQSLLPDKSKYAILSKAKELGLTKTKHWTKEEDDIIKQYYPEESSNVSRRLPGRSKKSCTSRAKKLGVKSNFKERMIFWTEEMVQVLKDFYPSKGPDYCAEKLGINKSTVKDKARNLKIKFINPDNIWSEEEDNILLKYYPIENRESFKRLNNRSHNECVYRIKQLEKIHNIKLRSPRNSWTKEEEELLIKNYNSVENKQELTTLFPNRTISSIKTKYRTLKQK